MPDTIKDEERYPDGSIIKLDGKNATVTILDAEKRLKKKHTQMNE